MLLISRNKLFKPLRVGRLSLKHRCKTGELLDRILELGRVVVFAFGWRCINGWWFFALLFSAIKEFSVRFIGSSFHPSQIGANIDELQAVCFFGCNRVILIVLLMWNCAFFSPW